MDYPLCLEIENYPAVRSGPHHTRQLAGYLATTIASHYLMLQFEIALPPHPLAATMPAVSPCKRPQQLYCQCRHVLLPASGRDMFGFR
jgi:hypothetical protein